jgi:hypothetical protein
MIILLGECIDTAVAAVAVLWSAMIHWYALGTIPMCRPKQAEGFQCILVKLQKCWRLFAHRKTTTLCIYRTRRLSALHSTASNHQNARCSWFVLPVTVSTLFPVLHSYLWSSLRSFPIPWPCLLPFYCKSLFHILFYTTYYRFPTISLLICCLVVISQALTSIDNPNTTQTLEYTKDKYNAKIIKWRVSPKVPPTT